MTKSIVIRLAPSPLLVWPTRSLCRRRPSPHPPTATLVGESRIYLGPVNCCSVSECYRRKGLQSNASGRTLTSKCQSERFLLQKPQSFRMRISLVTGCLAIWLLSLSATHAFQAVVAPKTPVTVDSFVASSSPLFSAATGSGEVPTKDVSLRQRVRKEGGLLSFPTKYGALNPFAIYYGLVAIGLGIPWFISLKLYAFFQILTRGRFDKHRRIPTFLNHVWGATLMHLTRSYPQIENMDILREFYKE